MVNAIFSSTSVVLCCLIFLSPPICSRSTGEGERRPPLTYPEFSLSSLTCLCLSPRSASLPLASLNPYLSRSFPSSRCTVCRLRRPSTVTKTGAARRPFTVYEGLLPPNAYGVAIIVNCRRSVKECSPSHKFRMTDTDPRSNFYSHMRLRGKG